VKEKIKITIITKNGVVKGIYSNKPTRLNVKVVDIDNIKNGETFLKKELVKIKFDNKD